ncbi:MAG: DUF3179 domain-containing protein [Phycisphaeraceae bacterium]|nr:DUF3179 domain-containing protein [Phycisphaeraceae bacterium]
MSGQRTTSTVTGVDRRARVTLGSGGWVLLGAGLVAIVVIAMAVVPAIVRDRTRPPGDGRDPRTYGFDLRDLRLPLARIVPAQLHRDMVPPLVDPGPINGMEVTAFNDTMRGKYVVSSDLVLGTVVAGEARAYPLSVMQVHEVVNDQVGGVPVLVTFNPLCATACVYVRRLGDGRSPVFGTSGLVYNSNPLLYDRTDHRGDESLWIQWRGEAISGPQAGERLERLPALVLRWSDWLEMWPQTTLAGPDAALMKRYRETDYGPYLRSERILFPVEPGPRITAELPNKTMLLIVDPDRASDPGAGPPPGPLVLTMPEIAERAGKVGRFTLRLGDRTLVIRHRTDPECAWIEPDGGVLPVSITCLLFAWDAAW